MSISDPFQDNNEFFNENKILNLDKQELEKVSTLIVEKYFQKTKSIFFHIHKELEFLLLLKEILLLLDYSFKDFVSDSESYLLKVSSYLNDGYLLEHYNSILKDLRVQNFSDIKNIVDNKLSVNNIGSIKKYVINYDYEDTARYLVLAEIHRVLSSLKNFQNTAYTIYEYFQFYDFIVNLVFSLIKTVLIKNKKDLVDNELKYLISFLNDSYYIEDYLRVIFYRFGFKEVFIDIGFTKVEDVLDKLKTDKSLEVVLRLNYPEIYSEENEESVIIANAFYEKTMAINTKGFDAPFKLKDQKDLHNFIDFFVSKEKIKFLEM